MKLLAMRLHDGLVLVDAQQLTFGQPLLRELCSCDVEGVAALVGDHGTPALLLGCPQVHVVAVLQRVLRDARSPP